MLKGIKHEGGTCKNSIQKENSYFNHGGLYFLSSTYNAKQCNCFFSYGMYDGVLQFWEKEILAFIPFNGNLFTRGLVRGGGGVEYDLHIGQQSPQTKMAWGLAEIPFKPIYFPEI